MFTVYVIYSHKHNKIYIGQTCDIKNRLDEHNSDLSNHTKKFIPWKIIYTEEYQSRAEAMKREKQLKSSRGRSFIWKVLLGQDKY